MKCVAVVWLSLLSLGRSAPESSRCDVLLKPVTVSHDQMLGRWLYIGGSSNIPGSRSLAHMMTNVWLNLTATTQSGILNLVQTQRIGGQCSSLAYDVIFENSTMIIEKPFYLKEVYLPTECSDCLVAAEDIVSGTDEFSSLLMFSRSKNVPSAALEMLSDQAECLQMAPPIILDPNSEMCPDNIPRSEGLSALNSLLEAKTGHRLARLLDAVFDFFILGKWVYIGESTNIPSSDVLTKMFVGSVWMKISAADQEDGIIFTQIQKSFGICSHITSNHTLRNNTLHMVYPIQSTAVLMNTSCPDCLVIYVNFTLGESSYCSLEFYSRRDKVSTAEKEEFKQQAACLNLPPVIFRESKNGFCPDPTTSQNSKSIQVTSSDFDQLDKILRSGSAVQILTDMASSLSSNEGQGTQS